MLVHACIEATAMRSFQSIFMDGLYPVLGQIYMNASMATMTLLQNRSYKVVLNRMI